VHAQCAQAFPVGLRFAEIGNGDPSTRFQHSHGFGDRALASLWVSDSVDSQAGDHQIKGVVGEWEVTPICCVQADTVWPYHRTTRTALCSQNRTMRCKTTYSRYTSRRAAPASRPTRPRQRNGVASQSPGSTQANLRILRLTMKD
jgi:hypothetical protein